MVRDRKGTLWRLFHGSRRAKALIYFLVFAAQIAFYTLLFHHAYPLLEGKPITWPASLLFVLETVTTVGYGDLLPFTNQYTVLIVILMMVSGIIQIFMVIPLLLIPTIGSHLQPSPPQRISHEISGHIVIIGYNPITTALVESLLISELPVVIVVDKKETAFFLSDLFGKRVYVIWGSYHDSTTWEGAWVKLARDVVVCEEEQTTASIIIGIRTMTEARIIAVVDKLSFERYLRYAGADTVLSPKHVTGQILARHVALTSHVDTLVEETVVDKNGVPETGRAGDPLRIINIPILAGSRAAGLRLGELDLSRRFGAECLLISRRGNFSFFPGPDEVLDTSTMLFLLVRMSSIERLVTDLFLPPGKLEVLGVVTGFGDVGRSAYRELTALGMECVVVDQKPYPVNIVVGKAEDEETLLEARIRDADFCIVALNDDSRNILTTLMVRNLNPQTRILARANEAASVDKLARAGADYVALLPSIGGQIVAGVLLAETVYIILSLPNGQVIVRGRYSTGTPATVSSIEKRCAVRVLGIQGREDSVIFPGGNTAVRAGDTLLVMGFPRGLRKFIRITQRDLV
jgi:Trk K+ transport system NAD-binding subunit